MTLGDKQRLFTRLVVILMQYAYLMGYEITFGDAYRDPRVHGEFGTRVGYGQANSFHKKKLAIDLNLFKDGEYLSKTSDHEFLGTFWEGMHEDCTWGGRFEDGNHYSFGEK